MVPGLSVGGRVEPDLAQVVECSTVMVLIILSILLNGPICSLGYFPFQPVVNQRLWGMVSCLWWDSVYKRPLAAYQKE